MRIAQIGPWEFEMPDGWLCKPDETSNSYFVNEEGTKGLYVKAIDLPEPKATAENLADYVQEVHFRGFCESTTNSWEVVDRRSSTEGELVRYTLDIYDETANYRVLSLVVSTADTAIQVSVHDYWCEDYAATRDDFATLEASIAKGLTCPPAAVPT